jgi:hypothetical protein
MGAVLQEGRGEILRFIDDDDLFASDKLEVVDRVFNEKPSLGYFHDDFVEIDESGKPFVRASVPRVSHRINVREGFRAVAV